MSESYPIEQNVPLSEPCSARLKKFPFRQMQKGDSFFVPLADDTADNVRSAASRFTKANPLFRFVTRRTQSGCRVWRIA